jgi:hypothetical protein
MPCGFRLLDGQLVGVIRAFACPTPTACCPFAGLVVTSGLSLCRLLAGSGGFLLPLGGLGGCSLSFQFGLGLADPLQTAAAPLEFFRQLITAFIPADLAWDYPDSVDRCQVSTGASVRVLMDCCS